MGDWVIVVQKGRGGVRGVARLASSVARENRRWSFEKALGCLLTILSNLD